MLLEALYLFRSCLSWEVSWFPLRKFEAYRVALLGIFHCIFLPEDEGVCHYCLSKSWLLVVGGFAPGIERAP